MTSPKHQLVIHIFVYNILNTIILNRVLDLMIDGMISSLL